MIKKKKKNLGVPKVFLPPGNGSTCYSTVCQSYQASSDLAHATFL